MQTFLPYPNYVKSAKVLDYKRLGKQRIEALMIIKILYADNSESRWKNHPAVRMWWGYSNNLKEYYNAIVEEWIRRGYKNNMPRNLFHKTYSKPNWIFDERFCISHQSNLVRKFPEHYKKFFPDVPDNLSYFWPSQHEEYQWE